MRISRFFPIALAAFALAIAPATLRAQSADQIHAGEDVDQPPKLANALKTAKIVFDSYPPMLKKAGLSGHAQVQFVVDAQGKVEEGSVEIVLASSPAFGAAAKGVVTRIDFTPGMSRGHAVRTRVLLPIMYK